MRMVAPRTGAEEITIAEEQPEYLPVVAAVYQTAEGHMVILTRWRPSDEERERLIAGEDLYISMMTFGQPMMPITVQVGAEGWVTSDPSNQ